ncbi:MAG TPA: hypothetical protein VD978_01355 [Azospirillum sp.]|nr:hypothetical protein [Azospirillum sp.]
MNDIRRTGDRSNEPIRSDGGGALLPAGRTGHVGERPAAGRQRIPSVRQLASLLVNGILTLPRNYRRGMFLDIMA